MSGGIIRYPGDIGKDEFLEKYAHKLLKCLKQAMATSYDFIDNTDDDESWFKYLDKNLDDKVCYIISADENRVKGCLVYKQHDDEVHIYDLYVHPDYHLDAITLRTLLKAFAKDISGLDSSFLWAYTNYKNKRMNAILNKHGFEVRKTKARGVEYVAKIDAFVKKFNPDRR